MKFYLVNLGCPKNLVDAEVMAGILIEAGFSPSLHPEEAKIIIVNTCAFLEEASSEAIETILQLSQYKETGNCKLLIVTGCLPARYKKEDLQKELPEVDVFLGPYAFSKIKQVIHKKKKIFLNPPPFAFPYSEAKRQISTPSHYAYLKIAEGCNHQCSFCIIPFIKGKYNSRAKEEVLKEAQLLVEKGVKELILVAQDTSFYGKDINKTDYLTKLLKELSSLKGIYWIRLLYLSPEYTTKELISEILSIPKLCPYFDIPIQHSHPEILKKMKRSISAESMLKLFQWIRIQNPLSAIRTSIIVGFPGEKDKHFRHLLQFIKEAQLDRVGVFKFSPEPPAPSAFYPDQIPRKLKEERFREIMQLQRSISLQKNKTLVGRELEVIVENSHCGRSYRDAPDIDGLVYIKEAQKEIGKIVKVKITEALPYDLKGEEVC